MRRSLILMGGILVLGLCGERTAWGQAPKKLPTVTGATPEGNQLRRRWFESRVNSELGDTRRRVGVLQANDVFPQVADSAQYDSGGYMVGAAYVIDAQGRYLVNYTQAMLQMEEVRRAQLENKYREFDWWMYRRANIPSRTDEIERESREDQRYTRFAPSKTEIWSGRALNVLVESMKRTDLTKAQGGQQTIDADVLRRINLTNGKSGSIGILKNEGKISWPMGLLHPQLGAEAEELRRQIQSLITKVYNEVKDERAPDPGSIREIGDCLTRLEECLRAKVDVLGFRQYVEAKSCLRQLNEGLTALQASNVNDVINGKYSLRNLKNNTISEVVAFMRDNGLEFAPACEGDYEAYISLHRALANFHQATHALTTKPDQTVP
jgi:hypothetical protein